MRYFEDWKKVRFLTCELLGKVFRTVLTSATTAGNGNGPKYVGTYEMANSELQHNRRTANSPQGKQQTVLTTH